MEKQTLKTHQCEVSILCSDLKYFTFEVNDTNSRPSTSSSSGCIATVNDGLWTTAGEESTAFQSLPREFAQRLFTLFFFLWGDDPGVDLEDAGLTDFALGVVCTFEPCCASGVTLMLSFSSLGSISGRFWTSTSSPSACLPLIQGTYESSLPAGLDIMGFSTNLVSCTFDTETGTMWFFVL